MRMRLTVLDTNRVILRDREGVDHEYWCPGTGGYVREITPERPGTLGRQVCDNLHWSGNTIYCSNLEKWPLADVIREHWRANLREQARLEKEWRGW